MSFSFLNNTFEAVIFDMDGTLVDNMMEHHKAWQSILKDNGVSLTLEEVKETIHGVNHEIMKRLFGDTFTRDQANRISNEKEALYRTNFKHNLCLINGAEGFLKQVQSKDIPMGIGTAAPFENLDFVLRNLPIKKYFSSVKHSGDVTKGKPDPEVFNLVAEEMGVDITRCLIFEDSVTGAQAIQNSGAKGVVITTTHHQNEFEGLDSILHYTNDYTDLVIS